MRYLESFFVRRVVVGQATKNINRILLRAVQDIRDQTPPDEALRDYLSTGRKSFATDAEIRAAVRTVPFYWSGRNNQKKLVLSWIEETYGSKEPVVTDQLTIEHVLPQTPHRRLASCPVAGAIRRRRPRGRPSRHRPHSRQPHVDRLQLRTQQQQL